MKSEDRNPKAEDQVPGPMKARTLILAVVLGIWGNTLAQEPEMQLRNGKLVFLASGTNEFTFDTGVLKGKLRADGKSRGLSSVVHLPSGATLDTSMGLFGHYRVFSANKRYS